MNVAVNRAGLVNRADPNIDTYESSRSVRSYAGFDELFPAEVEIAARYERQFSGAVLDIAVGAGRTTRALLPRAERYVGFDLSAGMLDLAKCNFPDADLRQLDMRETPYEFAGERFDAILISFNGIDYISWEDRNALLVALREMLTKDGVLAFSTHDLAAVNENRVFRIRDDLRPAWRELRSRPIVGAKKLVKLPFWMGHAFLNHLKNRPLEKIYDGFAYVNDGGLNYGLLTCYVSTGRQIAVLEAAGYQNIAMVQPWLAREPAYFNYFVCRRSG
jgi:SAM-dependent methyltransferase